MTSIPALEARIVGSGASSAALIYARAAHRHQTRNLDIGPSSAPPSGLRRTLATGEYGEDEEVAWYDSTVIWTKGIEVYRRWTFDSRANGPEPVLWAGFVHFPAQHASAGCPSFSRDYGGKGRAQRHMTFGPFHADRQRAVWSTSPAVSSSSTSGPVNTENVRTVMICLETRAVIYYPSGDQHTFHLPFVVSDCFPLPAHTGGFIVQRRLDRREESHRHASASLLRGLDHGHQSILNDVDRLEDLGKSVDSLPRLYTLHNPFDELRPIVEGVLHDNSSLSGESLVDNPVEVLYLGDEYPLVVAQDRSSGHFVFYARHTLSPAEARSTPQTATRHLHPAELLSGPTLTVPLPGMPPNVPTSTGARPSLQRTASTFSRAEGRRASILPGLPGDTMDRTRRGPRVSKGGNIEPQVPHPSAGPAAGSDPGRTGELQATLDPPSLASSGPTHGHAPLQLPGGSRGRRGKARASLVTDRRLSAVSANGSVLPDGPQPLGNVLFAAKEKDLRETTMMMGLETNETGRSELVLERIWVWKPPLRRGSDKAKVFLTDNLTHDLVSINIHYADTLYTFSAQRTTGWRISPQSSTPCKAALRLVSTRHNVRDTIILADNRLYIISAGLRIPLKIPGSHAEGRDELPRQLASRLSMLMDGDGPMGDRRAVQRAIIDIRDPVDTRFTVIYADGETIRLDADHRIKHALVRQSFEAIACFLPQESLEIVKFPLIIALAGLEGKNRAGPKAWTTFVDVLLDALGIVNLPPHDISGPSNDRIEARLVRSVRGKDASTSSTSSSSSRASLGRITDNRAAASCLLALHLVGQDCRLMQSRSRDLAEIARLTIHLSVALAEEDWRDYWIRVVPFSASEAQIQQNGAHNTDILRAYEQPPDVLSYLSRRLHTPLKPFPSPSSLNQHVNTLGISHPCSATKLVLSIYNRLGVSSDHPVNPKDRLFALQARAGETVRFMHSAGLGRAYIDDLLPGLAMPIWEMFRVAQSVPNKGWSVEMFDLIGRPDLAAQAAGGIDLLPISSEKDETPPNVGSIIAGVSNNGSKRDQGTSAKAFVRFGQDRREAEVERILQTTRVRTILVPAPKNASDADVAVIQQNAVTTIAHRTLSLLVGKGMFDYGTRTTKITDTFDVPLIELTVKVVPGKQTLSALVPPENADWPCFHNGVASALSISPDCKGIDSSWIVFNRPSTLNPEHGGFLLGLGLTGHLRSLATYHAFPYMEPRHDYTSVGLLLGLAASFVGSEDLLLTKVLSLHTHALLPMGSMELNASAIIQSTALVGLGLVYVGTRNLRMAEVALSEVGRKEMLGVDGFKDNVEAYSFSASMAFGLIMLGRGGQTTSEVDRRLLAKLTKCIVGAPPDLEGYTSATESNDIDTTITAPGATLALGLMYLRTERQDVADILEIPSSAFALEHVRPDILLLRTFARGLIMWDAISSSMTWIESQIPAFIDHKRHKHSNQLELQTELAYMNIIAGACLAIGLKYAGTAGETAHNSLMTCYNILAKAAMGTSLTYEGRIRRTAARHALNVVTIAWTVVMSGTGEMNVLRRLRLSHGTEGLGVTYGTHMALHMAIGLLFCGRGYYTLGSSNLAIAAMAISFFPRFAATMTDNRAYPQAFRHLWALAVEPRCLVAKDVDTRETVYLPVKIKLREDNPHDQGGQQIRVQSLISPTLIAPFEQIISIEIDSPRYWPITYDLSDERDRETLVRTRTIWVKRKGAYLDYNTDARGHRSIFVRAGAMTGWDLHYDLKSPAMPPSIAPDEVVELIEAHSGHPGLIALAKAFRGDTQLDTAIRTVLLECVSLDKIAMVPIYLALLVRSTGRLETIRQLAFIKAFYGPGGAYETSYIFSGREKSTPLIRINFVLTLYRILTEREPEWDAVRGYYLTGRFDGDAEEMAGYLVKHHVPPVQLLRELRGKVQEARGAGREVLVATMRESAAAYTKALGGAYDLSRDAERGTGVGGAWSMESADDTLDAWTAAG